MTNVSPPKPSIDRMIYQSPPEMKDRGEVVYEVDPAVASRQLNELGLGGRLTIPANSAKIIFGDDADDLLRASDIHSVPFESVVTDEQGGEIMCSGCYDVAKRPVEVDLAPEPNGFSITSRDRFVTFPINPHGDVLIVWKQDRPSEAHKISSMWKIMLGNTVPMVPSPVLMESIYVRNGAGYGLNAGTPYRGYVVKMPPWAWLGVSDIISEERIHKGLIRTIIPRIRGIVYKLRNKGIIASNAWHFFINPEDGEVVMGDPGNLMLTNVRMLNDEPECPQELLDPSVPYIPSITARYVNGGLSGAVTADNLLENLDYMLRERLAQPMIGKGEGLDDAIARMYARDLSNVLAMGMNVPPWWMQVANVFISSIFGQPLSLRGHRLVNELSEGLEKYADWKVGGSDAGDRSHDVRRTFQGFIDEHFAELTDAETRIRLRERAVQITHAVRLQESSKSVIEVPPGDVLEPTIKRLIDHGGVIFPAKSEWPQNVLRMVNEYPYVPHTYGMNWDFSMRLLNRVNAILISGSTTYAGIMGK